MQLLFKILLLCVFIHYSTYACYLWGTSSGDCTTSTLSQKWKEKNMPFCSEFVVFPTCVPKDQQLPPNREFPHGRWKNHTIRKKDDWVMHSVLKYLDRRIHLERNNSLHKKNTNEYGDPGRIKRRFYKRPDCQRAFKGLFCYINFPRCDPERDLTLPTCKSACENFFKACVYGHDLWRCGQSKFFNGYEPEPAVIGMDGNATYLRDYFPGQPFRKNRYNRKGQEIPICTPAVRGAGNSIHGSTTLWPISLASLVSVVVMTMMWVLY